MKRFLLGALALMALACASPSKAQTNACSGGGTQGMIVGGASGACYYAKVDSNGALLTVPSGGAGSENVTLNPSATVGVSTQSCTVACASTIVSGAHSVYGISGSSTVTGTILVYDATSCAANGTVTPKKAYAYTVANAPFGVSWADIPMVNATGIAVCFSSTGPYTATASTTAFLSVDYK